MKSIRNFTSLGDLILAQIDVAVVLRELAHARQSRQRARHLVAVQDVVRHEPQRQLAVRPLRSCA